MFGHVGARARLLRDGLGTLVDPVALNSVLEMAGNWTTASERPSTWRTAAREPIAVVGAGVKAPGGLARGRALGRRCARRDRRRNRSSTRGFRPMPACS